MQLIDLDSELQKYLPKNYRLEPVKLMKSGKEATVYLVKDTASGSLMALKIYKRQEIRSFKQNSEYLAGNYIASRTLRQAVRKKTKVGRELLQQNWQSREFYFLEKLSLQGANVPFVYAQEGNSMLMQYIGDLESPAPRLVEVKLSPEEAETVFETLLQNIEIFLNNGVVHGDLSAYNILWWQNQVVIIDFPQALDINRNPNSEAILRRDIHNLVDYFEKYLQIDEIGIANDLVQKLPIVIS